MQSLKHVGCSIRCTREVQEMQWMLATVNDEVAWPRPHAAPPWRIMEAAAGDTLRDQI
jgi:hypothetical protein